MTTLEEKTRRLARKYYNQLRDENGDRGHPSHDAGKALEKAAAKTGWPHHFGVEGFCDEVGNRGVTYLNAGDTYDLTICAITTGWPWSDCRFVLSSWGAIVERNPDLYR